MSHKSNKSHKKSIKNLHKRDPSVIKLIIVYTHYTALVKKIQLCRFIDSFAGKIMDKKGFSEFAKELSKYIREIECFSNLGSKDDVLTIDEIKHFLSKYGMDHYRIIANDQLNVYLVDDLRKAIEEM